MMHVVFSVIVAFFQVDRSETLLHATSIQSQSRLELDKDLEIAKLKKKIKELGTKHQDDSSALSSKNSGSLETSAKSSAMVSATTSAAGASVKLALEKIQCLTPEQRYELSNLVDSELDNSRQRIMNALGSLLRVAVAILLRKSEWFASRTQQTPTKSIIQAGDDMAHKGTAIASSYLFGPYMAAMVPDRQRYERLFKEEYGVDYLFIWKYLRCKTIIEVIDYRAFLYIFRGGSFWKNKGCEQPFVFLIDFVKGTRNPVQANLALESATGEAATRVAHLRKAFQEGKKEHEQWRSNKCTCESDH